VETDKVINVVSNEIANVVDGDIIDDVTAGMTQLWLEKKEPINKSMTHG